MQPAAPPPWLPSEQIAAPPPAGQPPARRSALLRSTRLPVRSRPNRRRTRRRRVGPVEGRDDGRDRSDSTPPSAASHPNVRRDPRIGLGPDPVHLLQFLD